MLFHIETFVDVLNAQCDSQQKQEKRRKNFSLSDLPSSANKSSRFLKKTQYQQIILRL